MALLFERKKTGNFHRVPCLSKVSGRVNEASLAKAKLNGKSNESRITMYNGVFCTKMPKNKQG
jgi:hypothetical protein